MKRTWRPDGSEWAEDQRFLRREGASRFIDRAAKQGPGLRIDEAVDSTQVVGEPITMVEGARTRCGP
jgi:hypothetical protein